jgi:outer membrane protein TolC/ABC-type uncharacterized transport system substrate-binding protein
MLSLLALPFVFAAIASGPRAQSRPVPQPVHVGVVVDGEWARADRILETFLEEIRTLTRGEFDVRVERRITADWTRAGVREAADALLDDPEIDLMLGLGVLATQELATRGPLPKPVVAPFAINPQLQELPKEGRSSGVENLSYVTLPTSLERDVEVFRRMVDFDVMAILIHEPILREVPAILRNVQQALAGEPFTAIPVPVSEDPRAALEALGPDVDAVMVTPLLQLDEQRFDVLVEGLIRRELPSFAVLGVENVEAGLLASIAPRTDLGRLARRVALNVQAILLGDPAADQPVDFALGEQLTINMRTARAIGYRPGWDVLAEAELLHPEPAPSGPRLTLRQAAEEAVADNLELVAARFEVLAGEQQVEQVRAQRHPLALLGVEGTQIDADRAESLLSPTGERSAAASLDVRQLLYSDLVNAEITIEEHRQARRSLDRRSLRLDIVEQASTAYLDVLRAKSFVRIERDNLKLTRSHLEMARVRRDVGEAGPSEVYRWESELARARRAVIDADAQLDVARYRLARLLHRPIEQELRLADADLENSGVLIEARRVERYIRDPWTFEVFRDFMVARGIELSPRIRSLDEALAAQRRAVLAARRSFWAPTATLEGGIRHVFADGGAGSDPRPVPLPGGTVLELPDDTSWGITLSLSYPLSTGGARPAALREARRELQRLRLQRDAAAESLELSIRSALQRAGSTYAAIELTRERARAAQKNLDVVSDAYSEGTVSILDLLDAQNAALVADQAAATAVYDHLVANLRVQRAVGRFDFFLDDEEARAWLERIDDHFEAAGIDVQE